MVDNEIHAALHVNCLTNQVLDHDQPIQEEEPALRLDVLGARSTPLPLSKSNPVGPPLLPSPDPPSLP